MGRAARCRAHFHRIVASLGDCWTRGFALLFGRRVSLVNLANENELECLESKKPTIVQPYGLTEQWRQKLVEAAASPETRLARQKVSFIGMWGARKGAKDWGESIRRVRASVPEAHFKF